MDRKNGAKWQSVNYNTNDPSYLLVDNNNSSTERNGTTIQSINYDNGKSTTYGLMPDGSPYRTTYNTFGNSDWQTSVANPDGSSITWSEQYGFDGQPYLADQYQPPQQQYLEAENVTF